MDPTTPKPGDFFPPECMHLLGTARCVIDQHVTIMAAAQPAGRSGPISALS